MRLRRRIAFSFYGQRQKGMDLAMRSPALTRVGFRVTVRMPSMIQVGCAQQLGAGAEGYDITLHAFIRISIALLL